MERSWDEGPFQVSSSGRSLSAAGSWSGLLPALEGGGRGCGSRPASRASSGGPHSAERSIVIRPCPPTPQPCPGCSHSTVLLRGDSTPHPHFPCLQGNLRFWGHLLPAPPSAPGEGRGDLPKRAPRRRPEAQAASSVLPPSPHTPAGLTCPLPGPVVPRGSLADGGGPPWSTGSVIPHPGPYPRETTQRREKAEVQRYF